MEARGAKAGCVQGAGCRSELGGGQAVGGNSVALGNGTYTCAVLVGRGFVLQIGRHSENTLSLG